MSKRLFNAVVRRITSGKSAALAAVWEAGWWLHRVSKREEVFAQAEARARALGRTFVVVGAPDAGMTRGPGCGDVTIDLAPSTCPNSLRADIEQPLPFPDNSCVVFVCCVLEYVNDLEAAMKQLTRISGGELFIVRVEGWTGTAYLYPGAKRVLPANFPGVR